MERFADSRFTPIWNLYKDDLIEGRTSAMLLYKAALWYVLHDNLST